MREIYLRWNKGQVLKFLKIVCVLAILFCFYLGLFNYTEPTEVGVARNRMSGQMWLQEGGGWHVTAPWVSVSTIDIRPLRVSVTTTGRGYSAKLVQFNAREWRKFVDTEGFRYYWWANRFSYNFGYHEEYRGMRDILRGYAYSSKRYPFLVVLQEYESQQ